MKEESKKATRDESRQWRQWIKKHRLVVGLSVWFIVSFVAVFGLYEALLKFGIDILDKLVSNRFFVFLLIALLVALGHVIYELNKSIPDEEGVIGEDELNDSIIGMLKDAAAHNRWEEIIKFGSSLSEVLWFTSRKRLRIAVGGMVELAAKQLDDKDTLAHTLIEDLGNTYLGLGDSKKAINYIKRGINIASQNNNMYLVSRGYRNLSNCYAYISDATKAKNNLEKSKESANNIQDERTKLDILGAIAYAESKIYRTEREYTDALNSLDTAIQYYNELGSKYPASEKANKDRLVKIHREKGILYQLRNGKDDITNAYDAFNTGLQLALKQLNYDNIIICCSKLAEISIDMGQIDTAESMIMMGAQYIESIDTDSIIKMYRDAKTRVEVERRKHE